MNKIERHIAGATVLHQSPFSDIEIPNPLEVGILSKELITKWCAPLYFGLHRDGVENLLGKHLHEVDTSLLKILLCDFNWRSKTTGAYLAALTGSVECESLIGRLLLRSDVCYVGNVYCLALCVFGSHKALTFITRYLDYYLTTTNLYFDQNSAMAALAYFDKVNHTDNVGKYMSAWLRFIENKQGWSFESSANRFNSQMDLLIRLKQQYGLSNGECK